MPYPTVDISSINQPVLTILGEDDSKLPINKAIYDYFYSIENLITKKYFIINENQGHFSCTNDECTIDKIVEQIDKFISNMDYYTPPKNKYKWFTSKLSFPHSQDIAYRINFLDALLKVANTSCWKNIHFLYFLFLKPAAYQQYQYSTEHFCLLKTYNVTDKAVKDFLTAEIGNKYNVTWEMCSLPTLHLSILVWLFKQPKLWGKKEDFYGEIIKLPINDTMTYYKFPTKTQFLNLK